MAAPGALGVVVNDRCARLHGASDDPAPGWESLPEQVACHRSNRDAEDQFVGLVVHEEQASSLAVQNGDSVLEDIVEQGVGFERGGQLPRNLVQRGQLTGAALGVLQEARFDDGAGGVVGDVLQEFQLPARIVDDGVPAGDAERADGLRPGVERDAHPGKDALFGGQNIARLAFAGVILRNERAGFEDDVLRQSRVLRQGLVFLYFDAIAVLHAEAIIEILRGFVVERDVEVRGRDDLRGLGVDEFQHIVEGQRDVHALRDARQGVHFLHAAFEVGNGLGALNGQGRLLAHVFDEGQVLRDVGLTGEARPQRHPAERTFLARQADEEPRSQQRQAGFFILQRGRQVGPVQVKGQALLLEVLRQRAGGREADIAGGTVVRAEAGRVLIVQVFIDIDVGAVGRQGAHHAFAQGLADARLVH